MEILRQAATYESVALTAQLLCGREELGCVKGESGQQQTGLCFRDRLLNIAEVGLAGRSCGSGERAAVSG